VSGTGEGMQPTDGPAAPPPPMGPPPPRAPQQPDEGLLPPVAIQPIPGTPYALALAGLPTAPSGHAAASLPVGIASVLVSFVVACFGVAGAQDGWGLTVAGAFALLAAFAAVAAITLGRVGLRKVRYGVGRVTGRGVAVSGIVLGIIGLGLTILFVLLAAALLR